MKKKNNCVIIIVILLVVVITPLIMHGIFKILWRQVPGKENKNLSSVQEKTQQSEMQNSVSTSILNQSDITEFDYGYYPDDHWVEAQCGFYVTPTVTGQLVLSIYYPFEITGNQVGHVFVDGQPCLDFTVMADNFEVNIPCQAGKRMYVQINSDFAREPGEVDKRALAFVLVDVTQKAGKSGEENGSIVGSRIRNK